VALRLEARPIALELDEPIGGLLTGLGDASATRLLLLGRSDPAVPGRFGAGLDPEQTLDI
jgi:hypothetical protein